MSELFSLHQVSVSYSVQGEFKPVLQDVNFVLKKGEHIGLYGPNGCGKTTFFRCITGLIPCHSGHVVFEGTPCTTDADFARLRKVVGFALQHADDQIFFPTVLEDVAFGPLNLGLSQEDAFHQARKSLAQLGMEDFADRLVHQLSSGEKRLIALAGILAMNPKALLLDEPTTGLDPAAIKRLTQVLLEVPCARITVSHDWEFLQSVSDRYITIDHARLMPLEGMQIHSHTHIHPLGNKQHQHP